MKKKSLRRLVLSSETLRNLSVSWVKGGVGVAIDSDGACPPSEPENTCYWGCTVGSCAVDACGQG
jgi:hypothetical protein